MANARYQPLTAWSHSHARKRPVKTKYTSAMMLQMQATHSTRVRTASAGRAGLLHHHLALLVLREGLPERLVEPHDVPVPAGRPPARGLPAGEAPGTGLPTKCWLTFTRATIETQTPPQQRERLLRSWTQDGAQGRGRRRQTSPPSNAPPFEQRGESFRHRMQART